MNIISQSVLTEDRVRIAFDVYAQGHQKVIVLAHGFYNSKQALLFKEMASMLSDSYDVIVLDFRGHGQSQGLFTWTAKEPMDLNAVLDFAKTKYQRIGVV